MRPRQAGFLIALLAGSLLLVLPQDSYAQSSKKVRNLVIQWHEGEVHLSVPGRQELVRVGRGTNMTVKELNGVAIITNEGFAEYSLDSRLHVTQEGDTAVTFEGVEDVARGFELRMSLDRGTATLLANPGRNNAIVVRASGVEVRATKKARFRMDADPDLARVTVFDGKVKVTSGEETREVAKGFSLTFSAGALTRIAQRKPSRTYGRSSANYPLGRYPALGGFSFNWMNTSLNNGWNCGWGSHSYYGGGIYTYPYGGLGDCGWPVYWMPPPPVAPIPAPRPPVMRRPPTFPRSDYDPRGRGKMDVPSVGDEVLPRPGRTMTTMRLAPAAPSPRFGATPEVLRPVETRVVARDNASIPHRSVPLTDRVDVQPIPRERAGHADMMPRAGESGSYRDPSGSSTGSSGSDRRGNSPSSGGGASGGSAPSRPPSGSHSSGSSSGGGAPAPHAAPPPAPAPPPAAPPSHPTQPPSRPGKPIE